MCQKQQYNSWTMKVYLHYEGSVGPAHTLPFQLTDSDGPDDILGRFVAAYNLKSDKLMLNVLALTLRISSDARPLPFSTISLIDEGIEEGDDLIVEDAAHPRKPSPSPSSNSPPPPPPSSREATKSGAISTSNSTSGASSKAKGAGMKAASRPPPESHPEMSQAGKYLRSRKYRHCRDMLLGLKKLASFKENLELLEMLANCYIEMKKYASAMKIADSIIAIDDGLASGHFLRAKATMFLKKYTDALNSLERTIEITTKFVKRGKNELKSIQFDAVAFQIDCLFDSGDHNQAATVLNESMGLEGMDANINFLVAYAKIAITYNKLEEAARCLLKAIVVNQNDKKARELVVILLLSKDGLEEVKRQLIPSTASAAAYALFATYAKDVSELSLAADLYKFSLYLLTPGSKELVTHGASYTLNLAHVYEAAYDMETSVQCISDFLQANRGIRVGMKGFSCGDLFDGLNMAHLGVGKLSWCTGARGDEGYVTFDNDTEQEICRENFDGNALELMALGFTLVKILYTQGKISLLPNLFRVIEPTRRASAVQIHETHIRNEAAYYCCIAQTLAERFTSDGEADMRNAFYNMGDDVAEAGAGAGIRKIYVCGDSHVMPLSWARLKPDAEAPTVLVPRLVTGVKHWHLRPDSRFYPKANFLNAVRTIPEGSEVIFIIGEIDCREGILLAVEKCVYESIEEGVRCTVKVFVELVKELIEKLKLRVLIHPIMPILDETREMVKLYNKIYSEEIRKLPDVIWLDFFENLLTPDKMTLRSEYQLDGTHAHPRYTHLIEEAIDKSDRSRACK